MFQLDDKFLQDIGLGGLPEEQRKAFLRHTYEELELRVGTKLSEGMNEQQMAEFESFVDRNEERVRAWFEKNMSDYATRPDYQQFAASAPQGTPEVDIMSEYASLKWLEINRPDYRQIVAQELEALKREIASQKDAILGGDDSNSVAA